VASTSSQQGQEAGIRSLAEIEAFHAHVYFDLGVTDRVARALRYQVADRFQVTVGRWHERTVGPHGKAMFQIAFEPEQFGRLVPWLMLNHAGLSILIHPNTANSRRDHIKDSIWIGPPVDIRQDVLPEENEPEPAGAPNTRPTIDP
jgi:aromatic ring-cleaving dioxygenase